VTLASARSRKGLEAHMGKVGTRLDATCIDPAADGLDRDAGPLAGDLGIGDSGESEAFEAGLRRLADRPPNLWEGTVLDGELTAGRFEGTSRRCSGRSVATVAAVVVFDVPVLLGTDLRSLAWHERRERLEPLARPFDGAESGWRARPRRVPPGRVIEMRNRRGEKVTGSAVP